MRITLLLTIAAIALAGCGNSTPEVSNRPVDNTATTTSGGDLETVTAHSADRGNKVPSSSTESGAPGGQTGWTRGGDPIDTTSFDAEIASAEKAFKAAPGSEPAKKALSAAYFKRGEALTQARQYAAALGDYRKAVKADPSNADAKRWIEQIIVIYDGLNKEYPKEGEEPPPLEFKKAGA